LILSERLKRIAEKVKYSTVCDIGADHGYLLIYLAQKGKLTKGAACDVNPGPLSRAEENIKKEQLEKIIETKLGDGLSPIVGELFESCVIAGMGGKLITDILSAEIKTAKKFKQVLLSPQRDCDEVRRFLCSEGFDIIDEDIVFDSGKCYNIIDCRVGEGSSASQYTTEADFMFGKRLIEKRHEGLKIYLENEIDKVEKILKKHDSEKMGTYLNQCREVYQWL